MVDEAYAPLVGSKPLWAGFYARYDAKRHVFTTRDPPRTKQGFRIKVLWVMNPRNEGPVLLNGENTDAGAPVRFHFEELGTVTRPELTPEIAGVSESEWREFPSYLYFDRAGCFTVEATGKDSSWKLGFGFGAR
jgi:hypothetical protein